MAMLGTRNWVGTPLSQGNVLQMVQLPPMPFHSLTLFRQVLGIAPATIGSNSNSLKGIWDSSQFDPTLPPPLTFCHIPTGILTVAVILNGQLFAYLSWLTHIFYFLLKRPILQIPVEHPFSGKVCAWHGYHCGMFRELYFRFSYILIQSFCEEQEAEEGREQMGALSVLMVISKTNMFRLITWSYISRHSAL